MGRVDRQLERAIAPGRPILVDSSVVLAYLTGTERTSDAARLVFDGFAATGRNPVAVSAVTVAEVLVRPFRRGSAAVATAEGFLRHFGDLRVVDVTYAVAREAARLRAATDLSMPDALIVGSAIGLDDPIVVTNDHAWPTRLAAIQPSPSCLVLPV